jgi:hypothetical protein
MPYFAISADDRRPFYHCPMLNDRSFPDKNLRSDESVPLTPMMKRRAQIGQKVVLYLFESFPGVFASFKD